MQTTTTSCREEGSCKRSIPTSFSKNKPSFISSRAFGIPNNPFLTQRWNYLGLALAQMSS